MNAPAIELTRDVSGAMTAAGGATTAVGSAYQTFDQVTTLVGIGFTAATFIVFFLSYRWNRQAKARELEQTDRELDLRERELEARLTSSSDDSACEA